MACKYCGELNHTSLFCWKHPRIIPKNVKLDVIIDGKHNKTYSTKHIKWLAFRKKWLLDNPPNHEGYYECYICGRWILAKEVTLDHILPRSRRPDLVLDYSNIRPCCASCNFSKGSKVIDANP